MDKILSLETTTMAVLENAGLNYFIQVVIRIILKYFNLISDCHLDESCFTPVSERNESGK